MSDDKNPLETAVDQAMDAFVYAPIGLVFDGPSLFPKLVEKGRNQVKVARMMGQMAVQMGQTEAGKRLAEAEGPLRDALVAVGVVPPHRTPTVATTGTAPTTEVAGEKTPASQTVTKKSPPKKATAKKSQPKKATVKKATARKATAKKAAPKNASAPDAPAVSTLGITDYDSLSASQVVKRLGGMAGTELDAIHAYEAATRARKTILNRVTQLQKD